MPVHEKPSIDNLAASKDSSEFDHDFRERARILLKKRDSGVSLLRYSISTATSNSTDKDKPIELIDAKPGSIDILDLRSNLPVPPKSARIIQNGPRKADALDDVPTSTSSALPMASGLPDSRQPNIATIKVSIIRKHMLPWLDGARQSVPRTTTGPMRGSFADSTDHSSASSALSLPAQASRTQKLPQLPLIPSADLSPLARESPGLVSAEEPIMRGIPFHAAPVPVPPLRSPVQSHVAQYENRDQQAAVPTEDESLRKPAKEDARRSSCPDNPRKGILKRPTYASNRLASVSEVRPGLPVVDQVQRMNQLLDQAVILAEDAAKQGKTAEWTGIIDDANTAMDYADSVSQSQRALAEDKLSDSDHTSTYSSISSSSDIDVHWDWESLRKAHRNGPLTRSSQSVPMVKPPIDVIVRDWANPGGLKSARDDESARCQQSMHDMPLFRSSFSSSEDAEARHNPLNNSAQERDHRFEPLPRQPMGYEGPDSPFDKSPTADNRTDWSMQPNAGTFSTSWGRDKFDEKDYVSTDALKGQRHITLKEGQRWSIHHHRRQPIARNWSIRRKRVTAFVTCMNTALIGMIIGIYAGEVPAIQFKLTDEHHYVNLGNVVLYLSMMVSNFLFWPLPLLHGRKPYTITALAVVLPLHFPQALMVAETRNPNLAKYRIGLLLPRAFIGFALGFVHVNSFNTLLDLFGASLQSEFPHGEVVVLDDARRHGGGMGLWLGAWSACFIGFLSVGFFVGAEIISGLDVTWGFYISVIIVAAVLLLDILTPETRRSPHRRTMREVQLRNMNVERRVGRGEVKIHVDGEGPLHWWEEVSAGIYLSMKMFDQVGFFLLSSYLAWVYAQVWLIIVLLGNLLSIEYRWRPEHIGVGALSMAVGATLAIPLSRANLFSRSRNKGPRTDSMTFQPRLTWTSHLVRRTAFMALLPLAGMAYTLGSAGRSVHYMVPIAFSGLVGFMSNLAVAECHGIIMETFDTSDLQPGVNSRHRLQSLAVSEAKRRTSYSSYPRVSAGLAMAHSLGFGLAAAATGVSGALTRAVGAQKATGIVAGILAVFTILLILALLRHKSMQVIPNELFGQGFGSGDNGRKDSVASNKSWRAVIIGNPSGKHRRMSLLELGGLSRWTEIRRLNRLLNRTTTQGLQPGWK